MENETMPKFEVHYTYGNIWVAVNTETNDRYMNANMADLIRMLPNDAKVMNVRDSDFLYR